MTLKELGNVFSEKVFVTVLGYYSNGDYYSFYSVTDEPVYIKELVKEESYFLDFPIKRISMSFDGTYLHVDVVSIIGEKSTEEV